MKKLTLLAAAMYAASALSAPVYAAWNDGPVKGQIVLVSAKKKQKPVTVKIGKKSFKCVYTPYGVQCACVEVCNYFGCAPMCR